MKLKLLLLFFISIPFFSFMELEQRSKVEDLKIGLYAEYMDYSVFWELTINEDKTFQYTNVNWSSPSFYHSGKWKQEKNRLILYDCDNNTWNPMSTKWKIKENKLIGNKVIYHSKSRVKMELLYRPNK